MQFMNKRFKAGLLCLTLGAGLVTPQTSTAYFSAGFSCNDDGLLWGIGLVAGATLVGCGIAAACGAFSWSDDDIIKWVRDGVENCDIRYQQLDQSNGTHVARLKLFGNRNKASWNVCRTDADEVTYSNPHIAPLHNALLVINGDIADLHNYQSYLIKRDLTGHPRGRIFYTSITDMLVKLEKLKDIIFAADEYTQEEHAVQDKVHQLRKERLDRERNNAMWAQANAQEKQAQALREQARKPQDTTIVIVSEVTSSDRDRHEKEIAEQRAERERQKRIEAEKEAERLRRQQNRLYNIEQNSLVDKIQQGSDPFNNATYLDY